MLRQVIVTIMGNVDSGKSQTIDTIKKTSIVKSEPGKITQTIKAYNLDRKTIQEICKSIMDPKNIKIPGLLFIDTPGHAAFSNLRKRGGALADIAILVVDINEGIKPQTKESIEILKETKTPFVIALNKIDLIPGWKTIPNEPIAKSIASQNSSTKTSLDNKFYALIGKFYELGLNVDRFDNIQDYTKTITAIPTSAKTGEGVPELLMVITGLAQRFLEQNLSYESEGPAEGTILEVIEEKGIGTTLDTIIYNGSIRIGDQIVIGSMSAPVTTKVKAIFMLEDKKLKPVREAYAAIGIKIAAPDIKAVIPGMPLKAATGKNIEEVKKEVQEQVEEITFEIDSEGIVAKADSLGSLEALINLLKEKNIPIKRASIGRITKKDMAEAEAESNPLNSIILGFRVPSTESQTPIICDDVIYSLMERFDGWKEKKQREIEEKELKNVARPVKIKILSGYVFRNSNPAIVGVEVISGTLKAGIPLAKEDKTLTEVKAIQKEGENITEAKKGEQVAVSLPDVTINRQVSEDNILYTSLTEEQFRNLKRLKKYLNEDEIQLLKEIAEIRRKTSPMWGI